MKNIEREIYLGWNDNSLVRKSRKIRAVQKTFTPTLATI